MSIIAIRWAYSQPIESPVAKNVLVFLCTHDFPGNTSVFKINTICKATGYSEKPVRNALNELHKLKYINKQERFGENGQKISNSYTILVPPEYVQKFTEDYELLTAPRSEQPVPPVAETGTPRSQRPDNKNNAFKHNIKKSFCVSHENQKDENQKKHEWAASKPQNDAKPEIKDYTNGAYKPSESRKIGDIKSWRDDVVEKASSKMGEWLEKRRARRHDRPQGI